MRSVLGALFLTLGVLPAISLGSVGDSNPKIPFYGYGAIVANPSSPIAGQATTVTVTVQNDGTSKALDVAVTLSFNDWGASFFGWQEIGTQVVDVEGGGEVTLSFTHVFLNRAHTCLEAKITDWNAAAGNTATNDDRGQINLEVLQCDGDCGFSVPIMNGGEKEIVVDNLQILCRRERKEGDPVVCNGLDDDCDGICDGLDNDCDGIADLEECPKELQAAVVIPGRDKPVDKEFPLVINGSTEVVAEMVMAGVEKPMDVVVQASSNGEVNHVVVQVIPTSINTLLNGPMFCCIKDIRTRVALEGLLASALEAYEEGQADAANEDLSLVVEILRLFVQEADALACESSETELSCIEKAILKVVDAIRIIARKNVLQGKESKIATGDQFRRAGEYGAACTSYAQGFDQQRISHNHGSAKKRIRQNAVRRLRTRN
mmetsp:Transcript_27225/g.55571  ORF Transcript_27225/g.55571 Transcript_27225/m.55571 type:complete len:432 (-) Transcript_27225:57-1352(-)